MLIKNRKNSVSSIVWISLLVIIITLLLSNKGVRQQSNISVGDYMQKFMSLNLGFSSPINLTDAGYGDTDYSRSSELKSLILSIPKIVKYNFDNYNSVEFERLDIAINFSNYQKINSDRKRATNDGLLSNPTKVNVKLSNKGIEYKAKLRLKGDNSSHWYNTPRLSFRIKVKNGKTLFGFSEFSIQKPQERSLPYDYTFQSIVRDAGNLSSEHKFVHLYVNGNDWGIMNIEEQVSKELLEKQRRKNSVIMRFSDEKIWLYSQTSKNFHKNYRLSNPILYSRLYNKNESLKDFQNRKIYSYISNSRMNKTPDIYDINSFSKAYMLALIWGNYHVLRDNNTRYYFNPYTLKLEPITTDQTIWSRINEHLLKDFQSPIQYIDVIGTKTYIDNLSKNLQKIKNSVSNIGKHLSYTQSLFPVDKKKNTQIVRDNMKKILDNKEYYLTTFPKKLIYGGASEAKESTLPTKQQASEFPEHLHIRHYTDGTLELYNLISDNVTVKDILFNGKPITIKKTIVPSYLLNPKPTIIKTSYKGIQDGMFTVNTQYQGFDRTITNDITLVSDGIDNPLFLNTAHEFNFINKMDEKAYEIKAGNWIVGKPIIVEGDLHISPGTNLEFSKNSYLIVKGSLTAIGSEVNPITLKAVSSSWKGIYVLDAEKKSHLKNVTISNLSALEDGLLKLTGGVTFYKSDVDFENVKINNVKAEDAINIVESTFSLNSVFINSTVSDGLDSDFSIGEVIHSEFSNIGGDALDFSGSDVAISQTSVTNVKDKAVSAGEKSTLNIKDSSFDNIGVGIASKDGSSVIVSDTKILNYELYAAMSYLKKDFYDMPSIILNDCLVSDGIAYIRQKGTSMTVDNVDIPESNLSVKKLYKTKVMAK